MSDSRGTKRRLDEWLVERGLTATTDAAQRLILAGKVRVNDQPADKAGERFPASARIETLDPSGPYVGRGGRKLRKALDEYAIDPTGMVGLDIGASTGGFTDCLLQGGAARVYAVDAGRNQLAWKLRSDSRVVTLEKVNARYLTDEHVPEPVDIVVIDVSFISATKVFAPAVARLKAGGRLIVLAKPQFEVAPGEVGEGGIVRDHSLYPRVIEELSQALGDLGLTVDGVIESPIRGADGNIEFLLVATLAVDSRRRVP